MTTPELLEIVSDNKGAIVLYFAAALFFFATLI